MTLNRLPARDGINVLAFVKGNERYVFLFEDQHLGELLGLLGRFATNSELTFSWHDAVEIGMRARDSIQAAN